MGVLVVFSQKDNTGKRFYTFVYAAKPQRIEHKFAYYYDGCLDSEKSAEDRCILMARIDGYPKTVDDSEISSRETKKLTNAFPIFHKLLFKLTATPEDPNKFAWFSTDPDEGPYIDIGLVRSLEPTIDGKKLAVEFRKTMKSINELPPKKY